MKRLQSLVYCHLNSHKLIHVGKDLLAEMWNIENVWLLERIDHARWLCLFNLACWCDVHYRWGCVCVHGINCAHPTPSLVQYQAKARTEPGCVWRVLSLSHAWVFSSTSGNHLSELTEYIKDVLVYLGHGNTRKNMAIIIPISNKLSLFDLRLTALLPPASWSVDTKQDGAMLSWCLCQILTLPSECCS